MGTRVINKPLVSRSHVPIRIYSSKGIDPSTWSDHSKSFDPKPPSLRASTHTVTEQIHTYAGIRPDSALVFGGLPGEGNTVSLIPNSNNDFVLFIFACVFIVGSKAWNLHVDI